MVRSWKLTARNSSGSKLMDSPRRPSVSSAKMSGEPVARAELGPGSGRAGLHACRMLDEGDVERPRGEQRGAGDGDGLEGYDERANPGEDRVNHGDPILHQPRSSRACATLQ